MSDQPFEARLAQYQARAERALERALELPDAQTPRLRSAMRYSVLGGGKRLRPTLVYAAGEAFDCALERLDAPAAAVELMHVYSLVHDDLPAMDDDDLRRGRPTCHRAFDEATAILTGDALQALAFAVLTDAPPGTPPPILLDMTRILAHAIGTAGMAGGQAMDLAAVGRALDVSAIEAMHRRKTGALIRASVLLGATAAGVRAGSDFDALGRFGDCVGLAFQIQDDILDVEGDTQELGKQAGADAARGKPNYPSTAGLAAARTRAAALTDEALAAIAPLGLRARVLQDAARFVVNRAH
jgi:farnesyl diphosphate synthase